MTQLIKDIHEIRDWPKDFTKVTVFALKKKLYATKCSHHHTISLTAQPAKTVVTIRKWRIERKIEDEIREDQFGFRTGKGTRGAFGVLRISELTWTQARNCVCFIKWQKIFYRASWAKLMQILKGNGIDWRGRILISKLYTDQSVKLKLNEEETRMRRQKEGVDKAAICRWFYSTRRAKNLPKNNLKFSETSE